MADYSIDEILAELDAKKSGSSDKDLTEARTAYICVKRTATRKMLTQNI